MKKAICGLLVLVMLGSLFGCSSNKRFDDEDTLMKYLEGMYALEDGCKDRTYYIFQDGKIYSFNDVQFHYEIENLFAALAIDDRLKELSNIDYETALNSITSTMLKYEQSDVIVKPKKGSVILNADKSYEKQIHIIDDNIFVKEPDDDAKTQLTKLSDKADFSGEYFQGIFKKTKDEYIIPMNLFLKSTEEIGNRYLGFWGHKTKIADNSYKLYYASGRETGVLLWNDTMFVHTTGKEATTDGSPTFQMVYQPGAEKNQLIVSDKMYPNFQYILEDYVEPVLKGIPGALNAEELRETFGRRGETTNGVRSCKFVQSGVEYSITIDYNIIVEPGHQTIKTDNPQAILIMITFQEGIALSSINADTLSK